MLAQLLAVLITFLLALSLWLFLRARTARRVSGVPAGHIVYADTGGWERCEKSLFSDRHRLVGKPDYLVRAGKRVIPVEVKPRRTATSPYLSDILQLGAYCLLVEEAFDSPPHGMLKYRDRAFKIEYTEELRQQVLEALAGMRRDRSAGAVNRSHDEPARCAGCGVRGECDQQLR